MPERQAANWRSWMQAEQIQANWTRRRKRSASGGFAKAGNSCSPLNTLAAPASEMAPSSSVRFGSPTRHW